MRRKDIYEQMKRRSCSDAREYRDTCERHGHSMSEYVRSWDRDDVADGCIHSYAGDRAIEAARDIKYQEQRREERTEEERQEEQREAHRRHELEQRQSEEEYYEDQDKEQPNDA